LVATVAGARVSTTDDVLADFLVAACVPRDSDHASGTLERAEAIRAVHPDLASRRLPAALSALSAPVNEISPERCR
jgi:hypothetical protein